MTKRNKQQFQASVTRDGFAWGEYVSVGSYTVTRDGTTPRHSYYFRNNENGGGTFVQPWAFNAALSDKKATIRTRHNTKFNAERVGKELATIAAGFEHYKAMAEGMVAVQQSQADVSNFFKAMLDIPFDAKQDDISGRKLNQFKALGIAYRETVQEGTQAGTAWTALNAITRWVDHDRSTRGGDNKIEAQVLSANFGSGAQLKAKAVELLMPAIRFPELLAA